MQHNSEFLYRSADSQEEEMMSLSFQTSYKCRIKLQSSHEHWVILVTFCLFSLCPAQIQCNKEIRFRDWWNVQLSRLSRGDLQWPGIAVIYVLNTTVHPAWLCTATRLWHTWARGALKAYFCRCETTEEFYWKTIQACLILAHVEFIFRESLGIYVQWFMLIHF